jgi:hypothetical protein
MHTDLAITDYSPEAWKGNALDVAEATFTLLTAGPSPLAVDGAALGRGLPARLIEVTELREILLCDDSGQALRDAAWAELIRRSRDHGPAWTIGCVGMALPGLKKIAARATHDLPAAQAEDVVAEMVAAFLAALAEVDIARHSIALRLMWTARRAATRTRHRETRETPIDPETIPAAGTPRSFAPPCADDGEGAAQVLADAVRRGVLTQPQAELITITRLRGIPVTVHARHLGVPAYSLYARRQRAEERLVAALRDGQLPVKPSGPTVNPGR